ncbi:rhomboid family intramembrane serine protease [Alkalicoccus chagannorensis]|uniref:rhomboid family intramembrane serine protease n=1 Tax=Alkalicoccus chagannorensis TaxID=427072 RepID=UPI0004216676|nr:rhomboid family intramembrane serine protease [Alkalicoccus chagannorensis]
MPPFTPDFQLEGEGQTEQFRDTVRHMVRREYHRQQKEDQAAFLFGKPVLTLVLLSVILAVFALMELRGSSMATTTLVEMGAKFDPLILEGEWWRFFSSMFLHIGFFHLFMNSLALYFLGTAVERIFGSLRFLWIYAAAGLSGSIASFVFNDNISAGASGAIFGLFGALLYFGLIKRRLFFRTFGMSVVIILIINLTFGFLVPMVDNGAHIGGLAGGFAAAAAAGLPGRGVHVSQPLSLAVGLAAGLFLWNIGFSQEVEGGQLQAVYYELGRESAEAGRAEAAERYLQQVLDMPSDGEGPIPQDMLESNAYFLLASLEIDQENLDNASELLDAAVSIRDDFHEAYYNLAVIAYEQGDMDEAERYIEEALRLETDEQYEELQDDIEAQQAS